MKFSRLISTTSMSDRCASALSKCIAAWTPANPPPTITILPVISQSRISLRQKNLPYLSACLLRPCSARVFHQSLLLPSTTEGLVKLNERQTLVQLGFDQVEFR